MDKLGIKIPNNYIDRMFGSEPYLIEDILVKVIKFVMKTPAAAIGMNPQAHKPGQRIETSVSKIERSSGLPKISTLQRIKKMRPPVEVSQPNLKRNKLPEYQNVQEADYANQGSEYQNLKYYNQPSEADTRKRQERSLPKISRKFGPSSALPKTQQSGSDTKTQARDLKQIMIIRDIVKKDQVVDKLEDAIKAAQLQVAELERLVKIKDKKIFLHQHKHDPLFRPAD